MEEHVAKLILAMLTVGFAFGFAAGYGIRAAISRYRRNIAERGRFISS